jgi:hypothetical protein
MPLLYSHSSKHSKAARFQTFGVRDEALAVKVFMGVVDLKTCLVQIAYYRRASCSTAFVSIDVNVKHLVHDLPVAIHF